MPPIIRFMSHDSCLNEIIIELELIGRPFIHSFGFDATLDVKEGHFCKKGYPLNKAQSTPHISHITQNKLTFTSQF